MCWGSESQLRKSSQRTTFGVMLLYLQGWMDGIGLMAAKIEVDKKINWEFIGHCPLSRHDIWRHLSASNNTPVDINAASGQEKAIQIVSGVGLLRHRGRKCSGPPL